MLNESKRYYIPSMYARFGLLFIVGGSAVCATSFYFSPSMIIYPVAGNYVNLGFTIGLGLISIGIALISIGISKESKKIAMNSDIKMRSIANVQFLQAVDKLEDARIEFIKTFKGIPGYSPELFTWKTKSCVKMAVELLKRDVENRYIDSNYQDDLFFYFNTSFIHFIKNTNWKKEEKSQSHMIQSYAMLDEYYNETRKKELEDFITDETEFKDFYKRVEEFKKTL